MKYSNIAIIVKRNKLSYFIISFVQGISSLADLAMQYYLKDELELEPYEMSRVIAFVMIPWIIKPFLGLLTDLVPIFGYRRKVYLILCGLIGFVSWLCMSLFADNLRETIVLLTLVNLAFSFASIIGEAIVVELSKMGEKRADADFNKNLNSPYKSFLADKKSTHSEKAKNHVSLFFLFKNIGALLSAFFRGYLMEIMSIRYIFFINAFIPLFILVAGLILYEHPNLYVMTDKIKSEECIGLEDLYIINNYHDYYSITTSYDEKREFLINIHKESMNAKNLEARKFSAELELNRKELFRDFCNFILQKEVYIPALFSVVLFATPNFADPFFYYMTNFLKFSPGQLGILSLITSFGVLIAIFSYRLFFKKCAFKSLVSGSTLLYFLFTFLAYLLVLRVNLDYGISDFTFCNFGFIFLSIVGEMSMMPILTLACTVCPKNLEATVYSFYMSAINFGQMLSTLNSSFITSWLNLTGKNFENLALLIIICNCFKIIPIIILFFIDSRYFEGGKSVHKEEEYSLIKNEHEEFQECVNPSENIKKIII